MVVKKFKHHKILIALSLVWVSGLFLFGCSGGRSSKVQTSTSTPSATRNIRPPEYRIGTMNELEIRFYYHERFNEKVTVRPDGRITLENVGDIYVVGLTPTELDQIITEAYSEIVSNPAVTVFVRGFGNQAIYVFGEVDQPGAKEIRPGMTALQALAAAGGPVRGAKLNSVVLLRRGESGRIEGQRLNFSRGAIEDAEAADQQLLPHDIIFVPRTFIASVNDFLSQIYDGIFPPFDVYLRVLREYNRTN